MSFPATLKYTKDHEWIKINADGTALVGITSYAVEQLGDIVYVDLPEAGKSFNSGDSFGTVESTKTVSDLYMPVTGSIVEANKSLTDSPETLQKDAFEKGWIIKIKLKDATAQGELLSAADYEKYIAEQE